MAEMPIETDDDLLTPLRDECVEWKCGRPAAEHVGWLNGGPRHDFRAPDRGPLPERVTGCHIETTWVCTQCGADCDVWGTAYGWMQCTTCWKNSYLEPFLTDTPATSSTDL